MELDRAKSEWYSNISAKIVEDRKQLQAVEEELVKATEKHRLSKITSPIDGVVQQLEVHTIGAILTPAQPIMLIAAWTRLGVGREFYRAWWGSLRGEFFAAYGLVMDGWNKTRDAWETGIAISVPGQFINSKILLIYDDGGELTLGFSLGIPRWWGSPLP